MPREALCGPHVGGGGQLIVHVLDCGITDESWAEYEAMIKRVAKKACVDVEVVRHIIDMRRFANFKTWTNGSKAAWARFLIPTLLADVDVCLYSDCDMLFVANPREMLDVFQDSDVFLAGHLDPSPTAVVEGRRYWQDGGIDEIGYLNSGLLFMNLKAFREANIEGRCFEFAALHPEMEYVDQTTLNYVCLGHRAFLPDGWGLFLHECHAFKGPIKAMHFAACRCWPWKKCGSFQNVAWLNLTRQEFDFWFEFEKRILGFSLPSAIKQPMRLRVKAACFLMLERFGNLVRVQIGQGRFQKIVAAYDVQTLALANARKVLFNDSEGA